MSFKVVIRYVIKTHVYISYKRVPVNYQFILLFCCSGTQLMQHFKAGIVDYDV